MLKGYVLFFLELRKPFGLEVKQTSSRLQNHPNAEPLNIRSMYFFKLSSLKTHCILPASARESAHSVLQYFLARSAGFSPQMVSAWMAAPSPTRVITVSRWPQQAARCSDVYPGGQARSNWGHSSSFVLLSLLVSATFYLRRRRVT